MQSGNDCYIHYVIPITNQGLDRYTQTLVNHQRCHDLWGAQCGHGRWRLSHHCVDTGVVVPTKDLQSLADGWTKIILDTSREERVQ